MSFLNRLSRPFQTLPPTSLPILIVAVVITVLLWALSSFLGALAIALLALMIRVYADPPRTIPEHSGLTLAAADGRITAIDDQQGLPLILERAQDQVEHFMRLRIDQSCLSTRTLRAPAQGTVVEINRTPITTDDPNEQTQNTTSLLSYFPGDDVTILIRNDQGQEWALTIRGHLIPKQIHLNVTEGAKLNAGDRIGMVFGLATIDQYIIGSATRLVAVNSHTHAGETVLTGSYANAIHRSFREI